MKTVVSLDNTTAEKLLLYTQAKTMQQGIYQAIEEYIRYKQRQELLTLRGTIDIEDHWQQLRELEKNT